MEVTQRMNNEPTMAVIPDPVPLKPNTVVTESHTRSERDVTGIEAQTPYTAMVQLMVKAGMLVVGSAVALSMLVSITWWILNDFKERQKETLASHKTEIETVVGAFKEARAEDREDSKERDKINRESSAKQWQQLREITTATQAGNVELKKATEILQANHELFVKQLDVAKKMAKMP